MQKYYAQFITKIKLDAEKPVKSNKKIFSRTRKSPKKGYSCLIGVFENRNKANKFINYFGLDSANFIINIDFEDSYDQEIEKEMFSEYKMIDLTNAKKLNDKIYKQWENSEAGKKFKEDWSFLRP